MCQELPLMVAVGCSTRVASWRDVGGWWPGPAQALGRVQLLLPHGLARLAVVPGLVEAGGRPGLLTLPCWWCSSIPAALRWRRVLLSSHFQRKAALLAGEKVATPCFQLVLSLWVRLYPEREEADAVSSSTVRLDCASASLSDKQLVQATEGLLWYLSSDVFWGLMLPFTFSHCHNRVLTGT